MWLEYTEYNKQFDQIWYLCLYTEVVLSLILNQLCLYSIYSKVVFYSSHFELYMTS